MGIPRLTQDLAPYTETAILGRANHESEDAIVIDSIVVDGPSLVYHVYNALIRHRILEAGTGAARIPTYHEIGTAAEFLLAELTSHGVNIEAIYFDGALPVGKEETRLQRLERTRKQLEEYRSLHSTRPPQPASPQLDIDFHRALWLQKAVSARRSLPAAPPFMVPAVIETLSKTRWGTQVQVVPEEADVACARVARLSGSAILSNDSDMCIYELGEHGCVVLLQSLEKKRYKEQSAGSQIVGSCIRPGTIAARLKISSLLPLAFERALDVSASVGELVERARSSYTGSSQGAYEAFTDEYRISEALQPSLNLQGLDPRTAEFVVRSLRSGKDTLQIYLPMLYEDITRDAAWSYGQQIRQLACSIWLAVSASPSSSKVVMEYARKGGRIGASAIAMQQGRDLSRLLSEVTSQMRLKSAAANEHAPMVLCWWTLAVHLVVQQKLNASKAISRVDVSSFFGLKGNALGQSWNDVHLHASAQAILYSTRILEQLLLFHKRSRDADNEPLDGLDQLVGLLGTMPPISELFVGIDELRALVSTQRNYAEGLVAPLFAMLREHEAKEAIQSKQHTRSVDDQEQDVSADGFRQPRKRIKRGLDAEQKTAFQHNMFHLLAEDGSGED